MPFEFFSGHIGRKTMDEYPRRFHWSIIEIAYSVFTSMKVYGRRWKFLVENQSISIKYYCFDTEKNIYHTLVISQANDSLGGGR